MQRLLSAPISQCIERFCIHPLILSLVYENVMITKYEESFSNTYVLKFRTLKVKW